MHLFRMTMYVFLMFELLGTPHLILKQLLHSRVKLRLDLDKSEQGVPLRIWGVCGLEEVLLDGLVHLDEVSLCVLVFLPLTVGGRGRWWGVIIVAVISPLVLQLVV